MPWLVTAVWPSRQQLLEALMDWAMKEAINLIRL
jgi:hypothetical protein